MLAYQYNKYDWRADIAGFRTQLKRKLTTYLQNNLPKELSSLYEYALAYVNQKTNFEVEFPSEYIYSLEELLNINWFPKS